MARLRLSRAVAAVVEEGESRRGVARMIGTSHAQIGLMLAQAAEVGDQTNAVEPTVPIVEPGYAGEYLATFGEAVEAIVAFNSADVLLTSGIHPASFQERTTIRVPTLLLRNERGQQLAVDDCNCGYGGTGPHNSREILLRFGFPPDLAELVFKYRYLHLNRLTDEHRLERKGISGISTNDLHLINGAPTAIVGHAPWHRRRIPPLRGHKTGEGDESAESPAVAWIEDVLNREPRLSWADGTRVARCYLSREAAETANLRTNLGHFGRPLSTVVIEQGSFQLWVAAHIPLGFAEVLSDETCALLAAAELYPTGLADKDMGSWVRRMLAKHVTRPPFIDISETGSAHLLRQPGASDLDDEEHRV